MANTNSDLATAQAAALRDPSSAPKTPETRGILYQIRGQVTVPATPSTSDTLTLVPAEMLPVGAVYEPGDSWVYCETDPGTALNLDIGPASNTDALADNLALTVAGTSSGRVSFASSGTVPAALADPLKTTEQEAILATVATSTAVDATVLQFCIAFRLLA